LPGLPLGLRERCRRIHHRLSDVGELRRADLGVRPDALSRRYRDAHPLALAILASTGLSMEEGGKSTWTFLFRTPEAVEEGLRDSLRTHLEPAWKVQKTGKILLGDRNRSLNPDLVFGDNDAVGDVKYRLTADGEIKRGDLNQVTTFATGYHAKKATVIAFGPCEGPGERVQLEHRRSDTGASRRKARRKSRKLAHPKLRSRRARRRMKVLAPTAPSSGCPARSPTPTPPKPASSGRRASRPATSRKCWESPAPPCTGTFPMVCRSLPDSWCPPTPATILATCTPVH
jgi:hypothetical protein